MKGSDAALRVSTFLADQMAGDEYARWPQAELFMAFKYALQQVAVADPTVFNGPLRMTLQEGSMQQLPAACNKLTDTADNLRPTSRISQRLVNRKQVCPADANAPYKPRSYSYDPDTAQNYMFISPPVPASAAGKTITVVCDITPNPQDMDTDVRMTGPMEGVVIDLMIFYLCSGENESASHAETAQRHFTSAMKLLGLDVSEAEARYRQKLQELRSGVTA